MLDPVSLCRHVRCRAGRECRVLSSGEAECVCRDSCDNKHRNRFRRRHSVCGSDGALYESHCELHRQACLSGVHIRAVRPSSQCRKDPLKKLKRMVDKAALEVKQYEEEHIQVPGE